MDKQENKPNKFINTETVTHNGEENWANAAMANPEWAKMVQEAKAKANIAPKTVGS